MLIEVKDIDDVFRITEPWYIDHCNFNDELKQLDVYVNFRREEATFDCSHCSAPLQNVYDIADYDRTWRHLNFLEYPCYIHLELPRTECENCKCILRVNVPWSIKPRANFTTLFDAWIITLAKDMPLNAIARLVKEHDTRLWRILHYYVEHAIATQDLSNVTKIHVDETSAKKGHNYVSIFMDADEKNVICVTKGRDASVILCQENRHIFSTALSLGCLHKKV